MVTHSTVDEPVDATMAPGPLPTDSEGDSDSGFTIARDIRDSMELLMWNNLTSYRTSPIVRSQLQRAGIILQTNDEQRDNTTTVVRDQLIAMALTPPITLDNFVPTLAADNQDNSRLQGHTVHKHHRLHNTPDHCINLHIHNRWNAAADNDNYGSNKPIYLLAWKTSINHILRTASQPPIRTVQFTFDVRKMSQSSSIQSTVDKTQ
eukprot:790718-Amphidinium_carterae.1